MKVGIVFLSLSVMTFPIHQNIVKRYNQIAQSDSSLDNPSTTLGQIASAQAQPNAQQNQPQQSAQGPSGAQANGGNLPGSVKSGASPNAAKQDLVGQRSRSNVNNASNSPTTSTPNGATTGN